jgi:hypothetical protein
MIEAPDKRLGAQYVVIFLNPYPTINGMWYQIEGFVLRERLILDTPLSLHVRWKWHTINRYYLYLIISSLPCPHWDKVTAVAD